MRIFITGATGYIGGAIARAARHEGHEVLALAHNAEAHGEILQQGFTPANGNLADPSSLLPHLTEVDAVIHAGFVGGPDGAAIDRIATQAMVTALQGSPRPFIYTSGVWVLGHTDTPAHESSPTNPIPLVAWRVPLEQWLISASHGGANTVIIRPGIAYGHGGGIPGNIARGVLPLINEGRQAWSVVHVDDLAELYLLALALPRPGSILHGVGAVLPALDLVQGESPIEPDIHLENHEAARLTLGDFADALALDQTVMADSTRSLAGWAPRRMPSRVRPRQPVHAAV